MSDVKDEEKLAFPYQIMGYTESGPSVRYQGCGMSLRDYFAAAALQAIVSQHRLNSCGDFVAGDGLLQHHRAAEYAAKTAYQFADAMLEEGEKKMSNDNKTLCRGCRDDFYNRAGNSTSGQCWMLDRAKVVRKTKVGTWQEPPYEWKPQDTLSCHHPEGSVWISIDDVRIVRNYKVQNVIDARLKLADATAELDRAQKDAGI